MGYSVSPPVYTPPPPRFLTTWQTFNRGQKSCKGTICRFLPMIKWSNICKVASSINRYMAGGELNITTSFLLSGHLPVHVRMTLASTEFCLNSNGIFTSPPVYRNVHVCNLTPNEFKKFQQAITNCSPRLHLLNNHSYPLLPIYYSSSPIPRSSTCL